MVVFVFTFFYLVMGFLVIAAIKLADVIDIEGPGEAGLAILFWPLVLTWGLIKLLGWLCEKAVHALIH